MFLERITAPANEPLSLAEAKALHAQCAAAPDQSRALFEAWIERAHPEWRAQWNSGAGRAAATTSQKMTRAEALAILGLKDGDLFLDPAQGLRYVPVEPLDLVGHLKHPVLLLDLIDDVPPLLGELGLHAAHLRGVVRLTSSP